MTIDEAIQYNKNLREYMKISDKESEYKFSEENYIALDMAIKALEQEPCEDCISREAVLEYIEGSEAELGHSSENELVCQDIKKLPSVTPQQTRWIPVSERLPEDLEPVNITWVNHEPEPYYHDIKDRNFVATGIYYRGQWYWYSTTCADYLGEYGSNEIDKVDDAVEIIAWMPLPEPYRSENE